MSIVGGTGDIQMYPAPGAIFLWLPIELLAPIGAIFLWLPIELLASMILGAYLNVCYVQKKGYSKEGKLRALPRTAILIRNAI
jgi:hypothetical protein